MYRFATGLLGDPQDLRRLGAAELLEVSQGDHLAVKGVQRVQGLLDPEHLLGPDRRVGGRREPAQQHRGQGGGAGLGQAVAVERDLLAGVAHLRAQVAPVADRQPLAHDQPQPEERRQLRALEVAVQAGGGVEERVLEHVGGVDPALEPRIHAQLDHPVQPIPVALEQVRQRLAVAAAKPLDEMEGIARIVRHESPSYPLTCAAARFRDKSGMRQSPHSNMRQRSRSRR